MSAYITAVNGQQKQVTNLRWLSDNMDVVESIETTRAGRTLRSIDGVTTVDICPDGRDRRDNDCLMIAWCKGATPARTGVYACHWASYELCLQWLDKYAEGIPLNWFGVKTVCGESRI